MGAAGGLTTLALASSLFADTDGGGDSYGAPVSSYEEPSYYEIPISEYHAPSSGYGHYKKSDADNNQIFQNKDLKRFHYQWQENIAKLSGRAKRQASDGFQSFIEVKF